jgi:hypothetical protein
VLTSPTRLNIDGNDEAAEDRKRYPIDDIETYSGLLQHFSDDFSYGCLTVGFIIQMGQAETPLPAV